MMITGLDHWRQKQQRLKMNLDQSVSIFGKHKK